MRLGAPARRRAVLSAKRKTAVLPFVVALAATTTSGFRFVVLPKNQKNHRFHSASLSSSANDRTSNDRVDIGEDIRSSAGRPQSPLLIDDDDKGSVSFAELQQLQPKGGAKAPLLLKPIPDPTADPADDGMRWMRNKAPWVHTFMRDSGLARLYADCLIVIGIPLLAIANPKAWTLFWSLSSASTTLSYGPHRYQTMDIYEPEMLRGNSKDPSSHSNKNKKTIVICHGGAWGSGRPWMYRLAAVPFLVQSQQHSNYNKVVVWGYRTYPDGKAADQVEDLMAALNVLECDANDVTLIGHSSGAHIALSTVLRYPPPQPEQDKKKKKLCKNLVLLAGCYDIRSHFEWETGRGVEQISAMQMACAPFDEWSPALRSSSDTTVNLATAACDNIYLLHGELDTVVPYTSTLNVTETLVSSNNDNSTNIDCEILRHRGHADLITDFMFDNGGDTADRVLKWLQDK